MEDSVLLIKLLSIPALNTNDWNTRVLHTLKCVGMCVFVRTVPGHEDLTVMAESTRTLHSIVSDIQTVDFLFVISGCSHVAFRPQRSPTFPFPYTQRTPLTFLAHLVVPACSLSPSCPVSVSFMC